MPTTLEMNDKIQSQPSLAIIIAYLYDGAIPKKNVKEQICYLFKKCTGVMNGYLTRDCGIAYRCSH